MSDKTLRSRRKYVQYFSFLVEDLGLLSMENKLDENRFVLSHWGATMSRQNQKTQNNILIDS